MNRKLFEARTGHQVSSTGHEFARDEESLKWVVVPVGTQPIVKVSASKAGVYLEFSDGSMVRDSMLPYSNGISATESEAWHDADPEATELRDDNTTFTELLECLRKAAWDEGFAFGTESDHTTNLSVETHKCVVALLAALRK